MKEFGLKFTDIMVGIVLGLGFQWWPNLNEPWQFVAFIFVYLSIIDYWIDTASAMKKYPPKQELDIMLDVAIMFLLFLYIYSTQQTILYFLTTFVIFRIVDSLWIVRLKIEYQPTHYDELVVNTWLIFNSAEIAAAFGLIILNNFYPLNASTLLGAFIGFRLMSRILSSFRYKQIYFIKTWS